MCTRTALNMNYSYEVDWERNLHQILDDVNCAARILQDKTGQIINTLLVASPSAGGGALPARMKEELTSIKNTQSLVQHQLGDLREYLEKNQAKAERNHQRVVKKC
ncbi:uncharacterized protein [Dysidea avara]|uniref:uncharacterized protein isoform X2 n=1 Tax=Dysidea avara TaxID=196820 RepID=UPI003333AF04